jgi:hypothetical protein
MPCLQVLYFEVRRQPRYLGNLGLEYLSSLHEINVGIDASRNDIPADVKRLEAVLRRTGEAHPNSPTIYMKPPFWPTRQQRRMQVGFL